MQYAVWRNDIEQQEGYSRELVSIHAPKDTNWDQVHTSNPEPRKGINTLMKAFLDSVRTHPNKHFLGTRAKNADGTFGAYQWLSYGEVNTNVTNLARGIKKLGFCPDFQAEGRAWNFCGIWARNR